MPIESTSSLVTRYAAEVKLAIERDRWDEAIEALEQLRSVCVVGAREARQLHTLKYGTRYKRRS